jgi:hypothetical protein
MYNSGKKSFHHPTGIHSHCGVSIIKINSPAVVAVALATSIEINPRKLYLSEPESKYITEPPPLGFSVFSVGVRARCVYKHTSPQSNQRGGIREEQQAGDHFCVSNG